MTATTGALEFVNVEKSFGEHRVLTGVSFRAEPGDVVALMGENGAGKSTLMRVLAGIYPLGEYGGEVRLGGSALCFQNAAQAKDAGIAMIHQELGLFPELTVAENILLDELKGVRAANIPWSWLFDEASRFLKGLGFSIDAAAKVGELATGSAQLVEIARALRRDAAVYIMDEPTSALTEVEAQQLFKLIDGLRARGKIVIYVSHRMDEIKRVCNRVVVLRDGQLAGAGDAARLTKDEIIRWMVGREVKDIYPRRTRPLDRASAAEMLRVEGFTVSSAGGRILAGPVDFNLCAGEILGLGGLMGAGRSELALGIYGYFSSHGRVWVEGKELLHPSPRGALNLKLAMLTEDRKGLGLFLNRPAWENMTLSVVRDLTGGGLRLVMDHQQEQALVEDLAGRLRVRGPSLEALVETYSGGNQQKVYLAKCLALQPRILILDEPTRGVDIGAKVEIYQLIREIADRGVAVLLISSEMPELLGLSDRVLAMKNGKFSGEFMRVPETEFNPEEILHAASL